MPAALRTPVECLGVAVGLVIALAASVNAQVSVTVQNIDGTSVSGRLEQLTPKQVFVRVDGNAEPLDADRVLRLAMSPASDGESDPEAREQDSQHSVSATPWLLTSTGDWLRVQPLMIDEESVVARWSRIPDQPPLTVPLEVCRGAVLKLAGDPYRQGIEFSSLFDNNQATDRIVLQNGDRIAGEFAGLDDGTLQIETSLGATSSEFDQVQSIAFNPELISTPDQPETHFRVVLRDGSLLRLKSALSNGGVLLGETLADSAVSLPLEHVKEIWFFDANRLPVSSLPVAGTKLTPYLSVRRPPQLDRNVLGGPLRVRGLSVASGIGMSSGSEITFALDARFSTLLGRVALDDAGAPAGSVRFEVVGDGTTLWHSETVTVESGPVELPRLDVSGVASLVLKVDVADRGPVRDIANWCDLVLLKSSQ
jgi:hypothetical protein